MKKDFVKYILVIVVTFLAIFIIYWAKGMEPIENRKLLNFPKLIGEWQSEEIPMSKDVYDSLETPYAFLRNYRSPHCVFPVNLSIVWFDDRYMSFHTPEACLGGVGNFVKTISTDEIYLDRVYDIAKLIVDDNGVRKIVLYFYDEDGFITTSQSSLRIEILKKNIQYKRSSVTFIRIMAPVITSEEDTIKMMKAFIKEAYKYIPEYTYTSHLHPI